MTRNLRLDISAHPTFIGSLSRELANRSVAGLEAQLPVAGRVTRDPATAAPRHIATETVIGFDTSPEPLSDHKREALAQDRSRSGPRSNSYPA